MSSEKKRKEKEKSFYKKIKKTFSQNDSKKRKLTFNDIIADDF